MPQRPMRPCSQPGCGALTQDSRCPAHKTLAFRSRFANKNLSSTARGYGEHWKKLRVVIFQRDTYFCQPCRRQNKYTIGTICDHIVSKSIGGTDDTENLQTICGDCNRAKTLIEARGEKPRFPFVGKVGIE